MVCFIGNHEKSGNRCKGYHVLHVHGRASDNRHVKVGAQEIVRLLQRKCKWARVTILTPILEGGFM